MESTNGGLLNANTIANTNANTNTINAQTAATAAIATIATIASTACAPTYFTTTSTVASSSATVSGLPATAVPASATSTATTSSSTAASVSSIMSTSTSTNTNTSTSMSASASTTSGAGQSTLTPACASVLLSGLAAAAASHAAVPPTLTLTPTLAPTSLLQQLLPIDTGKALDDANNSSLASAISEGQRSLSGAPSASSSPILSPPGKIFGRNANGTMIATSRPSNEAEVQLYRVLQRASLLAYYDTLLEMGGDDVQQLYEAGEEEFLEIMALVGMASKPLHVRRLQKALHEWANNPALFQGPMLAGSTAGLCETPTKPSSVLFNPEASSSVMRSKFNANFNTTPVFNPTPLISTAQTSSSQLLSQMCSPAMSMPPTLPPQTTVPLPTNPLPVSVLSPVIPQPTSISTCIAGGSGAHTIASVGIISGGAGVAGNVGGSVGASAGVGVGLGCLGASGGITSHQVTSSSPQLTPVLTEMQVSRITLGAEKIARHLPQREPRAQTSKKRTSRELEQVMNMSESDPRRMDEIRKYSAIYGRFDCKRRPEKPLTLHEVCVNEAAAQLCRLVPALLTRRDELFPLARQIVKDAGFGHSASIARYGGLLQQMQSQVLSASHSTAQRTGVAGDCESSDSTSTSTSALPAKRQRLSSSENSSAPDLTREPAEDSRFNLFAMYQKFAKPPFDMSDVTKYSLVKSDFDDNDNDNDHEHDNDNDNDSRLSSFSNSSSPSMPANGLESERDLGCGESAAVQSESSLPYETGHGHGHHAISSSDQIRKDMLPATTDPTAPLGGVQVISAAGGHIIAVANPALALSPTLNEALNMKRETHSPDN